MSRDAVLLVLLASLVLIAPTMSACDDDGGPAEPNDTTQPDADGIDDDVDGADTTPDTGGDTDDVEMVDPLPDGPTVVYDKERADDGEFFAFPFPSSLRTRSSGAPDLDDLLESPGPLAQSLLDEIGAQPGFSPQTSIYFQLEAAIDPASVPASVDEATDDEASVYVINLEPSSPDYLDRHPVLIEFSTEAGAMAPANLLTIQPLPGHPLRSGERYAAVLTRDIALDDGSPIGAVEAWESSKTSVLPPPGVDPDVHAEVRQLLIDLEEAGIAVDDVLVASAFETADTVTAYDTIFDALFTSLAYVPPTTFDVVELTDDYHLYEGTIEWTEFLDLSAPTTPGALIELDDEGKPQVARTLEARFAVMASSFPKGGMPVYQIFVVLPPAGGDYRAALDVLAPLGIPDGYAFISIDAPLVGNRNPGSTDPLTLFDEITVANPLGYRDLVIQALADQIQVSRLIEVLTIPEESSPFGQQIGFSADPLIVTGTGLHAQALALASGSWLTLESLAIAQAGGGLGAMLAARTGANGAFEGPLATALGAEGDSLDSMHPAVSLLLQPALDRVDPVYVAPRAFEDPIGVPKDIFLTRATADTRVSPESVETLSVAYGAPPVEPVGESAGYWEAAGLRSQALPVQANIDTSSDQCERNPCQVTAATVSFAVDHDVFRLSQAARDLWAGWFAGAVEGRAPLLGEEMMMP